MAENDKLELWSVDATRPSGMRTCDVCEKFKHVHFTRRSTDGFTLYSCDECRKTLNGKAKDQASERKIGLEMRAEARRYTESYSSELKPDRMFTVEDVLDDLDSADAEIAALKTRQKHVSDEIQKILDMEPTTRPLSAVPMDDLRRWMTILSNTLKDPATEADGNG